MGGDEFIVILPNIRAAEDAARSRAGLIAELQEPMRLALHTLVVTPSIGVAMYPADGVEVDTLLRNADLAMYFAKRKGPGMSAFYDTSMNDAALHRFTLEAKLPALWSAASSPCIISRNSTCAPAAFRAWRRCCVGPTTSSAWYRRWSSFRWPKRPD